MNPFGDYVRDRRLALRISLRDIAERLELSPTYWSDIENGKRNPPSQEKLERLCSIFELPDDEKDILFDLATDAGKGTVIDLADYIMSPPIRRALRAAKKLNVSKDVWEEFEDKIKKDGE